MADMRTVFAETVSALLDEDPLAAVVLAEISVDMFGKAAARHPERVLNVGIREQLMVSVGGGLALAGMRPIVHTYAPFLVERAFEQVKLDLGHQDAHAVLVSIGASYDAARAGRTHQAPEDVALMDSVPGFSVVVPGHPAEVEALLREAVGALDDGSTYMRLSTEANREARPVWPGLQVIRTGRRAVVVAVGPMLSPVLEAVGDLDVTVAYATTVRPFDAIGLRSLEAGSGAVVLVEPYLAGTSSHAVASALASRPHRLLSLGVPRTELRRYGTPVDHAVAYGLDAAGIRRSVTGFIGFDLECSPFPRLSVMRYRTIGSDPATRREVSVLSLGAMLMGSQTDEATSFAILDRFVEAGGTFIDTSGNYAFWVHGTQGGESEELLGRWRRSRGIGDEIVIATKVGARPLAPASGFGGVALDGLSAKAIRESAERSMSRMGVARLDLMYAHVPDSAVPLSETVEGFAELVSSGFVGLLGVSNHWAWMVERARALAAASGLPGYEVLQYCHTYLRQRADLSGWLSPDGEPGTAGPDLLSYVRSSGLPLVAYSPLLGGAYVRPDKPLGPEFDHAGTPRRLAALAAVAAETGATVNQVVLAWLMGGELPVIPLVGASSVAQLEESLGAVDLDLSAEQRVRLDQAG